MWVLIGDPLLPEIVSLSLFNVPSLSFSLPSLACYILPLCLYETDCDLTHTGRVLPLSLLRVSSIDTVVHWEQ